MGRFPPNVISKTINAIAYGVFGYSYRHKHGNNLRAADVRAAIDPLGEMNYRSLMLIAETVRLFMISSDMSITIAHAEKAIPEDVTIEPDRLVAVANRLWAAMIDPAQRDVHMTHDAYLKLLHQSAPDFGNQHDLLIVDEGQDVNEVTLAIIESQSIPVIMIGDPHQSIYRFRGAVSAMETFQAEKEFALTYSFRFGCQAATLANQLLFRYKHEEEILIGAGPDTQISPLIDTSLPYMKIHRTVADTIRSAADAVKLGKKIAWVGGVQSYGLSQVRDLYWLFSNQRTSIQDFRLVKEFPSYEHYKAAAKETRNAEMTRLTKIVEEYGRETPALLEAITANTCEIEQAQITLTTAHRSKGLQADRVQLAEDFPELRVGKMPPEVVDDETNLLYVAMTRCRQALGVPEAILDQIR